MSHILNLDAVEAGGELLRQDRRGDERHRFHRRRHVADRVEPAVGGIEKLVERPAVVGEGSGANRQVPLSPEPELGATGAGEAIALIDMESGFDARAGMRYLGADVVDIVIDIDLVLDGFGVVVIHHEVLFEKAESLLGGRGGEADQERVEVFENLAPEFVDGPMALVGNDEVESFDGDRGIVFDGFGQFGQIGPGFRGLRVLVLIDFFADQHGIEALDGGYADLANQVDVTAAEELGVVKLREFAAVIRRDELLEFVESLAAESPAIDQEQDTACASEFDEPVDEVAGSKCLATACGHLDESAGAVFGEGLLQVEDGARLCGPETAIVERRKGLALPEDLATSSGELTNAVFGFSQMLLKAVEMIEPTHIIMALDRPVPTFRHQAYAEYKATRPPTPRPLVSQFQRVRQVADAMNIPIYEQDGYEADDILGTLSKQAGRKDIWTIIVTGDLDAVQLVDDRVHILTPRRGIAETMLYDSDAVRQRYGLEPEQIPDYKALVGDTSDNIPGVKGIGDKTASRILSQYGTLEGVFEHLGEIREKERAALESHREQVFQSRELARILRDVPVTLDLEASAFRDVDRSKLLNLFRDLEFRSLIERVQAMLPREAPPGEEAVRPAPDAPGDGSTRQLSIFGADQIEGEPASRQEREEGSLVTSSVGLLDLDEGAAETVTRIVRTEAELEELLVELRAAPHFALDTETTSTDPLCARLVGLSFATRSGHGWYVPVGHAEGEQLPLPEVLAGLRSVLSDGRCRKVGHNLKYDLTVLTEHDVEVRGLEFDTMIAAYLVKGGGRGLSLSALALARLGIEMTPIERLIGKGKNQITMDLVDIATVARYAGADADVALRLRDTLEGDLVEQDLTSLFRDVEMPLVPVLADMERVGVALDTGVLADMSREMTEVIGNLEGRIYESVGHRFNINSTQQLGQVLFQELSLPHGRRTKTGYSTDNEVLENLRGRHPVVDDILEYRQLIKLKNTYVDALPSLINPETGRVHTDFNQTVAATGRLSSSNPNLQNIPIRGELGRKIRRAFVPSRPDHVILGADYSQIELRILASMSKDERLLRAFQTGEDIHAATASAVFGVSMDEVAPDQRRIAKVVNFGIIYGIGERNLAYQTGITSDEAREFIASYNQTYAGVKAYMDRMRKQAAFHEYVSTMLGRRRYIPEIHSDHPGVRAAAERAAINMPVQGTAADIIKIAMIRLHEELGQGHPQAHMVLQVHDELVFDVPESQAREVGTLVREIMEHALPLEVPLEVEVKVGRDWYDMAPLEGV